MGATSVLDCLQRSCRGLTPAASEAELQARSMTAWRRGAAAQVRPRYGPPMNQPEGQAEATQPELARTLGFAGLVIYGVGDMLGAGVYGLMGKAARHMGNAIWLSFVVGMVAAAATGLSYASLGSRYPRAAGASYIVDRAFGKPLLAYVVGLTVMASGLTSMAAAARVFAGYFTTFAALPRGVVSVAFVLLLALVAFRGMRESTWLNALCTLVEVGGLLFIIAWGARTWGGVDYLDARTVDNPEGTLSFALLQGSAVLTFYAFVGFEDMLNVAEEVKDVQRTLPFALLTALGITTLVYVAVSITAISVVPSAELARSERPLVDVAVRAAPWLDARAYTVVALFAVTNTALLNFVMGSRLVYGMSRQRLLPAWLGAVHATRRTPHRAILGLLAIVMVLVLAGDISSLAKATSVLLLLVFTVVNASLLLLQRRADEPKGAFEVPWIVPLLGMVVNVTLVLGSKLEELVIAGSLVALATLLYTVVRPSSGPAAG
jgi:APA family basic amino acid/polyamine antiporter